MSKRIKNYMSREFEFDKFICDEYMLEVYITTYKCAIHIEFASMCLSLRDRLEAELEKSLKNELNGRSLIISFDSTIPLEYFSFKEFEKILGPES